MSRLRQFGFAMAGLAIAVAGVLAGGQVDPHALQRMVASERAFAAATAELGVRDGFLAFFADDAIQIEAGTSGRDTRMVGAVSALAARPLPPLPLGVSLLWNPHTGQISGDGSLGWLTGPFVVMNQTTQDLAGQGAYFSVWKRQPDRTWRVWLDEGITLPETWRGASDFRTAPAPEGGEGGGADETAAAAESDVADGGNRWHRRWSASVRVHRQGRMPIAGREAAGAWARETWPEVAFTVARVESAASNDLAVTVGGYDARTAAGTEHGTWVRVWHRDTQGRWRIVFETSKAAG